MIYIKENILNAKVFLNLHRDDMLKQFDADVLNKAFLKNLYDVVLFDDNQEIGMGRVVGDGVTVFFIKDIIIKKEFRGFGYSKLIIESILKFIKLNAVKNAYIGLMATKGTENIYKKYGFIERPNDKFGSGMVMFNE